MNPEIKKMWIDALRSGRYSQGYGGLRKDASICVEDATVQCEYCALGVLCDIAAEQGVIDWIPSEGDWSNGYMISDPKVDEVKFTDLPPSVRLWAGLEYPDPTVADEDGGFDTVIDLNDMARLPFSVIADRLENDYTI